MHGSARSPLMRIRLVSLEMDDLRLDELDGDAVDLDQPARALLMVSHRCPYDMLNGPRAYGSWADTARFATSRFHNTKSCHNNIKINN